MSEVTFAEPEVASLDISEVEETAQELSVENGSRMNGGKVVNSWFWSRDTLVMNLRKLPWDDAQVLIEAWAWCKDPAHPLERTEFSKRIRIHDSTLTRLLNGTYTSKKDGVVTHLLPPKEMMQNIREFLRLEKIRVQGKTTFVHTKTSADIWRVCELARESQTPAIIWGPSHCGKTWALEAYKQAHNHGRTIYVRMSAKGGANRFLRDLAKAMGISTKVKDSETLKDRIVNSITPDMLLIFDEITTTLNSATSEKSFFAVMESLREILDRCQVGAVISGTKLMLSTMKESSALEQLLTRGIHRMNLEQRPHLEDVKTIFESSGLSWQDVDTKVCVDKESKKIQKPYEIIKTLVHATEGRLKSLTERIRYARRKANHINETLNWTHFVWAHNEILRPALSEESSW